MFAVGHFCFEHTQVTYCDVETRKPGKFVSPTLQSVQTAMDNKAASFDDRFKVDDDICFIHVCVISILATLDTVFMTGNIITMN